MTRTVEVTLKFSENDLQAILDAANFDEEGALQLSDMDDRKFAKFAAELKDSAGVFTEEIVEGSYDACANDWMHGWGGSTD